MDLHSHLLIIPWLFPYAIPHFSYKLNAEDRSRQHEKCEHTVNTIWSTQDTHTMGKCVPIIVTKRYFNIQRKEDTNDRCFTANHRGHESCLIWCWILNIDACTHIYSRQNFGLTPSTSSSSDTHEVRSNESTILAIFSVTRVIYPQLCFLKNYNDNSDNYFILNIDACTHIYSRQNLGLIPLTFIIKRQARSKE